MKVQRMYNHLGNRCETISRRKSSLARARRRRCHGQGNCAFDSSALLLCQEDRYICSRVLSVPARFNSSSLSSRYNGGFTFLRRSSSWESHHRLAKSRVIAFVKTQKRTALYFLRARLRQFYLTSHIYSANPTRFAKAKSVRTKYLRGDNAQTSI